jgi:hypothetical protein
MIIIETYMLICGLVVLVFVPIHSIINHKKKQAKISKHLEKYLGETNA